MPKAKLRFSLADLEALTEDFDLESAEFLTVFRNSRWELDVIVNENFRTTLGAL